MPRSSFQSNAEITIEPLQVNGLKTVIQLERDAKLNASSEEQLFNRLHDPQSLLLVALRQADSGLDAKAPENIVGLLSGWVVLDELEIDNLVVAEDARGRGVGRKLLTEGLCLVWHKGAKIAYLEVRADNVAAINLYTSLGFVVTGRRKNYYSDPLQDALMLRLDIQKSPLSEVL